MFKGFNFLIINSNKIQVKDLENLKNALLKNNCVFLFTDQNEDKYIKENELKFDFNKYEHSNRQYKVTHIISESNKFKGYDLATIHLIPIIRLEWIYECIKLEKITPYINFNSDSNLIFNNCFICIDVEYNEEDKQVLHDVIRIFGGCISNELSLKTTHLIATNMCSDNNLIVRSIDKNFKEQKKIEIHAVRPLWLFESIIKFKKLNEVSYFLSNDCNLKKEIDELKLYNFIMTKNFFEINNPRCLFLKNKVIYLHFDYKLSELYIIFFSILIKHVGAKLLKTFNENEVEIYIGKYRNHDTYTRCFVNKKIIGNLKWFFTIFLLNKWIDPFDSNLLLYPEPQHSILDFEDLQFSITKYTGEKRNYVIKLITILGGKFNNKLTRDIDYLVCFTPDGKKYDAVRHNQITKKNNQVINLINHLWLESCYSKLKIVNNNFSFDDYSKTSIKIENFAVSSDDKILMRTLDNLDKKLSFHEFHQSNNNNLNNKNKDLNEIEAKKLCRFAAQKSKLKIKEDLNTFNEYSRFLDNDGKDKTYKNINKKQDKKIIQFNINEKLKFNDINKNEKNLKKKKYNDYTIIAILTGNFDLKLKNTNKFKKIGVLILESLSDDFEVNTLIAPEVLRTEKFLRCLSKVNLILHSNFIRDLKIKLSKMHFNEIDRNYLKTINLQDYFLDNFISIEKTNLKLGINNFSGLEPLLKHIRCRKVFEKVNFLISTSFNDKIEVMIKILLDHGMENFQKVPQDTNLDDLNKLIWFIKKRNHFLIIFVLDQKQDIEMILKLESVLNYEKFNFSNVHCMDWDWCVKSIFSGSLLQLSKIEPEN